MSQLPSDLETLRDQAVADYCNKQESWAYDIQFTEGFNAAAEIFLKREDCYKEILVLIDVIRSIPDDLATDETIAAEKRIAELYEKLRETK